MNTTCSLIHDQHLSSSITQHRSAHVVINTISLIHQHISTDQSIDIDVYMHRSRSGEHHAGIQDLVAAGCFAFPKDQLLLPPALSL